jgi:hypothetical protein
LYGAPAAFWALPPVYWIAHALMAGSFELLALVAVGPDPLSSELEHAAANNATAASATAVLLMLVLMWAPCRDGRRVCQNRRLLGLLEQRWMIRG